jgi:hypothetical protein
LAYPAATRESIGDPNARLRTLLIAEADEIQMVGERIEAPRSAAARAGAS